MIVAGCVVVVVVVVDVSYIVFVMCVCVLVCGVYDEYGDAVLSNCIDVVMVMVGIAISVVLPVVGVDRVAVVVGDCRAIMMALWIVYDTDDVIDLCYV